MNKELQDNALSGNKDSIKRLQELALQGDSDSLSFLENYFSEKNLTMLIMQRILRAHFGLLDGKNWSRLAVVWSPWHHAPNATQEPECYIDGSKGIAFRNIKIERKIELVQSDLLDPNELIKALNKSQEKEEKPLTLQQQLDKAIEEENYEEAARLRDAIKAKSD